MKKLMYPLVLFFNLFWILSCGKQTTKITEPEKKDSTNIDSQQNTNAANDSLNRKSAEFTVFLPYFLQTCYYQQNLDSLVYHSSPTITSFMNKKAGFGRYYNRGAFCNLFMEAPYDYPFTDTYQGEVANVKDLAMFNKKPVEGFCEESKDPNGVYYYETTTFPDSWDMNKDKAVKTNLPVEFKQAPKMKVDILVDKYIAQQFYFAQIENIWYLVYIDDCDCSA
jgi:hypothetical protein